MTKLTATSLAHPSQHPMKLLLSVSCGMFLLMLEHDVQADGLKDPTQPPASLSAESNNTNGQAAGPVLQSVMLGSQYRAAIINGQKVMLGGKYESATLIKINEREAVLRNSDMTTQVLAMDYAGVKKTKPVEPMSSKPTSSKPKKY